MGQVKNVQKETLRWLDWTFYGEYLPSLGINYVGISKYMGKRLPQLYEIKMKISYKPGFYCNQSRHGNVMTPLRFVFIFVFLCTRIFFVYEIAQRSMYLSLYRSM